MKKKRLTNNRNPSDREFLRAVKNPHVKKYTLNFLRKYVAKKAEDRQQYGIDFLATWYNSSSSVAAAADRILNNDTEALRDFSSRRILAPFTLFTQFYFSRLADDLEYAEEECFEIEADNARQSWQKFFAALPVHHPDLANDAAEGRDAVIKLVDFLFDLYTGESQPVLTAEFIRDYRRLESVVAKIAGRMRS